MSKVVLTSISMLCVVEWLKEGIKDAGGGDKANSRLLILKFLLQSSRGRGKEDEQTSYAGSLQRAVILCPV